MKESLEESYHLLVLSGYKDGASRYKRSIEPIVIIDARLKEECKSNPFNWIMLGYMPQLNEKSIANNRNFGNRMNSKDINLFQNEFTKQKFY